MGAPVDHLGLTSLLLFYRLMRKTGKLYTLTLASSALTIFASAMVALWNENSAPLHLWLDLFPQGFGMASLITTTLIVRLLTDTYGVIKTSQR